MTRVTLVRHGRAAAGWDADLDPGLDPLGKRQASQAARALASTGPRPILSSPLRRARETAASLERLWGATATVCAAFGEIPSPTGDLAGRGSWLRGVMAGTWGGCGADLLAWRSGVLAALRAAPSDAVVFTHFIAINVVVGAASQDDRVVVFAPDNASRTEVDVDGDSLEVVELGAQARTVIG